MSARRIVFIGLATCAVLLLLAGVFSAVGFNIRAALDREYSSDFQANLALIPSLVKTVWRYGSRNPEIAGASDVAEILKDVQPLRIAVYRPWRGYDIPVYEGLSSLDLSVSVLEPDTPVSEIVGNYDVIIFPQGAYHLRDLPVGEAERLRAAIASGVDYIGLCAGTFFAVEELKLAPISHAPVRMVALIWMRTVESEYWDGLDESEFQVHYANGGVFPPDGLGSFEPLMEAENFGYTAVRGRFGRGELVLFTFHPEGGGITLNNQTVYFTGRELGSGKLLLWALKRLSEEQS